MSNIPIIKFLFRNTWKVLEDSIVSAQSGLEVEEFDSANDIVTHLSNIDAALIMTSLTNKEDLIQLATLMKVSKKVAVSTALKVVVVNFIGDKQFDKAIAKLGILDIVEPRINTKALRFKIDFWMKSLNGQVKSTFKPEASKNARNEVAKTQDKKIADSSPVWIDPLDCEDDIWIIKTESDCKKVLSRWLVKLMGPSPYVGQWVDIENRSDAWKFDLKSEEKEMFISGKGNWFFLGDQKPEFVWKENLWLITGDKFELLYKDEDQIHVRLKLKDRVFSITKNSEFAKTKEQLIIESFDKEHIFKKENIDDRPESLSSETERYKNLEGKGKTEQLIQKNLSGKAKTDSLNQGPLSGEFNPNDLVSTDPLSQEGNSSKEQTKWSGRDGMRSTISDLEKNLKKDGLNEGTLLDLESGNEHKKYYKNRNPAEEYTGKQKEKNGSNSPDEGGKTSTDKVSRDGPNFVDKKIDEFFGLKDKKYSHLEGDRKNAVIDSQLNDEIDEEDTDHNIQSLHSSRKKARQESANDNLSIDLKDHIGASTKQGPAGQVFDLNKAKVEKDRLGPDGIVDDELENAIQSASVVALLLQNSNTFHCHLDDFFDHTITFFTSQEGLEAQKAVQLDLSFNYKNKVSTLKFAGNIQMIDALDEKTYLITVEISQESVTAFDSFMKLYQLRQENVNNFFKRAKGF